MTKSTEYLSVAETAKLVRKALKKSFPETKFSARSKSYAGGASIDVRWTDGPQWEEVTSVVYPYQGAGFDGMIDLKFYIEHYITADGEVHLARTPGTSGSRGIYPSEDNTASIPDDARRVQFGADHIFCYRDVSDYDQKYADALDYIYTANLVLDRKDEIIRTPELDMFGRDYVSHLANKLVRKQIEGEDVHTTFRRLMFGGRPEPALEQTPDDDEPEQTLTPDPEPEQTPAPAAPIQSYLF